MYYEIDVPQELYELAKMVELEGSTLYVVGGYIRDTILGKKSKDIDICANIEFEKMMHIAKQLGYRSQVVNEKLGTVLITANNWQFEYTPFRKENYKKGEHSPSHVSFVKDIKVDASRRDLTVNALYYDILKHNIIDFYGGVKDIQKGVVRAIETPQKVFSSDGLRILRLIRFACVLGFKIDSKTQKVARQYLYFLKDISKSRINKEFEQLIDNATVPNSIDRAIEYCNKWHIWDYVLGIKNIKATIFCYDDIVKENAYDLVLYSLMNVAKDMTALDYYIDNILGKNGLQVSNEKIKNVTEAIHIAKLEPNIISALKYLNAGNVAKEILRVTNDKKYNAFEKIVYQIKKENLPTTKAELDITPQEILDIIQDKSKISFVQTLVLQNILLKNINNKHDEILQAIMNIKERL